MVKYEKLNQISKYSKIRAAVIMTRMVESNIVATSVQFRKYLFTNR